MHENSPNPWKLCRRISSLVLQIKCLSNTSDLNRDKPNGELKCSTTRIYKEN